MRIYQRGSVWYIDYSFNGRRVRKAVSKSKKMAQLALKEVELKIAKGEFLGVTESKRMVFDKLCEEYLSFSKANKVPQSYRRDMLSVKHLLERFGGKLISEITAHEIDCYKNVRVSKVKPATVNREVACVKHMFTKAVDWGYVKNNPLKSVKRFKEPPGRVRYLTELEIERLLECCTGHVKNISITALNTGMRLGEILNLKWSDVNTKARTIIVTRSKNNEMRMIPVNDTLYEMLKQNGPQLPNQYVFTNDNGKPYGAIKTGFRAALRRAGITDFRFHDLRHTFASRLVMAGVDIRTVQELLGHKDIRMTMRYSHLLNVHLKQAVKKLEHGTNMAQTPLTEIEVLAKH